MSDQNDPFTEVLDAIWRALEAWPPLAKLVSSANRIKLPDVEDPYKTIVTEEDLPEMTIEPASGMTRMLFSGSALAGKNYILQAASGTTRLSFSSSHFQPVQNYSLKIATGRLSPREYLAVKWAVICALANANRETHPFGLSYVHDITIIDDSEALNDSSETRAGVEWSGRITIQVTFNFNRDLMIAPN